MGKRQKPQKKTPKLNEPRINDELTFSGDVRVVYSDRNGIQESFSRVMTMSEARRLSDKMELDLIEINPKSEPPIIRLDNYSKFMFEAKKRLKSSNKKTTEVKEIQLTTNISEHDMETKIRMAEKFLSDGDKVRVVLKMRGRELARREQSKKSILLFIDALCDKAVPESMPKDEGNKCVVILKKKG